MKSSELKSVKSQNCSEFKVIKSKLCEKSSDESQNILREKSKSQSSTRIFHQKSQSFLSKKSKSKIEAQKVKNEIKSKVSSALPILDYVLT